MSVYWPLGGIDWGESRLTLGSILKPCLAVAGGNFLIFVVIVPQESGTRAGGSLNEKMTKRPRHAYNYPSNCRWLFNLYLGKFVK